MIYRSFFKPVLDRVFGLVGILLFFPVLVLLSILICIESFGIPIYKQKRVGKGAREFSLFKLRSMCIGADKIGSHMTEQNDPRVTRVGGFVRRTSLDELPQFFNLLNGTMSLIGPRPDVPVQRELYTQEQWDERLSVVPGITGLAQATMRSTGTLEDRLKLDLEYVRNVSLAMDFKVLLLTAKILFDKSKAN